MVNEVSDDKVTEILRRVKNGELVSDLAREYGIGASTIRGWISGRRRTTNDFDPEFQELREQKRISELEKENKYLYELVGRVTSELKKAKNEI